MNKANYFIFAVQVVSRNSGVYILKGPQGEYEWNSKWRKDTKRANRRKISP